MYPKSRPPHEQRMLARIYRGGFKFILSIVEELKSNEVQFLNWRYPQIYGDPRIISLWGYQEPIVHF